MNQAILLESNADNIDFMIHGIFSIKVFGQEVWITTSHACILIVMAIMVIFAIVANRKLKKAKEVPDGFQNIIELIVEMLDKMVEGTMGKWAPRFVNYISTIFIFILMSNISGLFGLRPPTADYGTTLALLLFVGIPLPGTGAWTGTLAGSILDMKFKDVVKACMGGVLLAGIIMGLASAGLLGALSTLFSVG